MVRSMNPKEGKTQGNHEWGRATADMTEERKMFGEVTIDCCSTSNLTTGHREKKDPVVNLLSLSIHPGCLSLCLRISPAYRAKPNQTPTCVFNLFYNLNPIPQSQTHIKVGPIELIIQPVFIDVHLNWGCRIQVYLNEDSMIFCDMKIIEEVRKRHQNPHRTFWPLVCRHTRIPSLHLSVSLPPPSIYTTQHSDTPDSTCETKSKILYHRSSLLYFENEELR